MTKHQILQRLAVLDAQLLRLEQLRFNRARLTLHVLERAVKHLRTKRPVFLSARRACR
jgi:hypothetical protein